MEFDIGWDCLSAHYRRILYTWKSEDLNAAIFKNVSGITFLDFHIYAISDENLINKTYTVDSGGLFEKSRVLKVELVPNQIIADFWGEPGIKDGDHFKITVSGFPADALFTSNIQRRTYPRTRGYCSGLYRYRSYRLV